MARTSISIRAGSSLSLNCAKKDSAGAAESLSGVTVAATLNESSTNKVLATPTITVTNSAGGLFSLDLSATQTAAIGPAGCTMTIKYTYGSGAVDILDSFPVELRK